MVWEKLPNNPVAFVANLMQFILVELNTLQISNLDFQLPSHVPLANNQVGAIRNCVHLQRKKVEENISLLKENLFRIWILEGEHFHGKIVND